MSRLFLINLPLLLDARRRRSQLTRSLSASRPSAPSSQGFRKRTASENLQLSTVAAVRKMKSREKEKRVDELPSVEEGNTSAAISALNKASASDLDTSESLLALDRAKGLECLKVMRGYMATCWWFVQPLLFCLIGADIPVEKLRADTIGSSLRWIPSKHALILCLLFLTF